jgi:hypothetical protein
MNSSNSLSNSKWASKEALQARRKVVENLGEEGLAAFLEALVVEAQRPVPPTLSNWQVHRAWADGALNLAHRLQEFLSIEKIDQDLRELDDRDRQLAARKPVGEQNPWKSYKDDR